MSLRKQIEKLEPGESIVLETSRSAVYVAAKRAGIRVATEIVPNDDFHFVQITRKGEPVPGLSLVERVAELSPKERLELFAHFELCCGMNRGECICPKETIPAGTPLTDMYPDGVLVNGAGEILTVPVETWIEDPQTYENGEILYWHHKPKCKPVCYRRESSLEGA